MKIYQTIYVGISLFALGRMAMVFGSFSALSTLAYSCSGLKLGPSAISPCVAMALGELNFTYQYRVSGGGNQRFGRLNCAIKFLLSLVCQRGHSVDHHNSVTWANRSLLLQCESMEV